MEATQMIHGNSKIHGYVNLAFHARSADGDRSYFLTSAERDTHLARFRAHAIGCGLSVSAARSGIYPISTRASALGEDELDRLEYPVGADVADVLAEGEAGR